MLFPDWVDCSRMVEATPQSIENFKLKLSIPLGKTIVGYSGNIAQKQGLERMLEVVQQFHNREDIHFVIFGEGAAKSDFVAKAKSLDLQNLSIYNLQPESLLNTLLSSVDLHLIYQRPEFSDLVMPGKVFNIMACARPFIVTATQGSSLQALCTKTSAGIIVDHDDQQALAKQIQRLITEPNLRRKMSESGRKFVEREMDKELVLSEFIGRVASCKRTF